MINKLIKSISPEISLLLNHEFIVNLSKKQYRKSQLKLFAEQYYLVSVEFITLLLYGALNIKLDENRLPIISNLWDEHGRGDIGNSHRELLKFFLIGIDKSVDFNKIQPSEKTKIYIEGMRKLLEKSSELETLCILGPACESFTAAQYKSIYTALITNYSFTKNELMFFKEHVIHDERHSTEINNVLEKFITSDEKLEKGIVAAKKSLFLEKIFWDGLQEEYAKLDI
jgi:pyrroloquinoline quinone (PQQ) biosynthesis protein C